MSILAYLLVGLFLPLFPFSMPFNLLYAHARNPVLRGLLLLLWPQIGLVGVFSFALTPPRWVLVWALLTSLLYALRALTLREVGLWTSFVATSSWALQWLLLDHVSEPTQLLLLSLCISVPLVLLAFLGAGLEQRFGAAYLGLYGGLAQSIPRFSGVLVAVVLAIVATPVFPAFFAMFSLIISTTPVAPLMATGVGLVWLFWSWAGARLLQGLIVGPGENPVADLGSTQLWLFIVILASLTASGIYWIGAIS